MQPSSIREFDLAESDPAMQPIASLAPSIPIAAPEMPGSLQAPQSSFMQNLGTALLEGFQGAITNLMDPGPAQHQRQALERQKEQKRKKLAGEETQAMTGMISTALASGNPEQLATTIKQLSGLKHLQPETVEAVQKLQVSLGEKIAADRADAKMVEAVEKTADTPMKGVITAVRKHFPTIKMPEILALVKAGVFGHEGKTETFSNGMIIKHPNTGLFRGPDDPVGISMLSEPAEKKTSPSVGVEREALAQALGHESFQAAPTNVKDAINKQVKVMDEKRLELQRQNIFIQGNLANRRDAAALRDDFTRQSKPFIDVRDAYNRIKTSAPTAAGDISLIFGYMRMLDPQSTVREGEFATAQNSAGLPEILRAKYNKVISGERLGDDQRKDFVDRAEGLYGSQLSIQKRQEDEYRRLAKNRGANPENVVIDRALPPAQQSGQEEVPLVDASGRNRIGLYQGNKFLGFKGE